MGQGSKSHLRGLLRQVGDPSLLRGAERTVARDRPLLCLEFEPYLAGADHGVELARRLEGHGYGQFRVFHANAPGPAQAVDEWANTWAADEVIALVRRNAVGPYGTLFAVPMGWPG